MPSLHRKSTDSLIFTVLSNCAYYPGAKPGKKHALNNQYTPNSELRLLTRVYGTTISCRLPFLSFSSFFLQHQVRGLGESKEPSATAFHASPPTTVYTAANDIRALCHPEVNDVMRNGLADKA